jgi:hypothetical protein
MSTPATLISRKEIALRLGVSVDCVRRNESKLGLRAARMDLNPRVVRYHRSKAESILKVGGWI